jgi:hypothetical protein
MTPNRKAELQRKLSMTPLPKPPAGLSERIKREIPKDLRSPIDRERERFSRSSLHTMRLAASILLLVGGAFVGVHLLSRMEAPKQQSVARQKASPAAEATNEDKPAAMAEAPTAPPVLVGRADVETGSRNNVERDEERRGALNGVTGRVQPPLAAAPPPPAGLKDKKREDAEPAPLTLADATERGRETLAGTAGGVAQQDSAAMRSVAATAPAMAAKSAAVSKSIAVRSELFGISVDRQAFDRVKSAIERGERPAASTVDVAALVNYFAGAAPLARRDVVLDLEASSRPVPDGSSTALVRCSVDTSAEIADATLELTFDSISVSAQRRIGDGETASATERIVPASRSVTALYEVTLRPNVRARQAVAMATLTYRSADGQQHTLRRGVSYNEAIGAWKNRSRRHRLATLGAMWGESLRASTGGADVARTAEELSKQEPQDEKAKELATLATASSRLRSSSPTGSGR